MVNSWSIKKISELADIKSGGTPPTTVSEYWDGDIVWVVPTDITNKKSKYITKSQRTITKLGLENSAAELLPKGTILLCSRATIGELAIAAQPMSTNQGFKNLVCHTDTDNEFLYYALQPLKTKMIEQASGSTFLEISKTALGDIQVLTPPLPEQRAIAAALSDVDEYISALEKLIDKKRVIKQGAMQELLTGKRRLPGFEGEWAKKRVGEIGYPYSGLTGKRKEHFGKGSAKYITFLNVLTNTIIDIKKLDFVDVSEEEKQNPVKYGDLFFNASSETPQEVGMCAVLLEPLNDTYLNSFCFGFRLTDTEVDGLYLSYFFNSNEGRKIMVLLAQGATRYNLSKTNFLETVIALPNKDEQKAIAQILFDMDAETDALIAKLEKAKQIKQGMMSELLTGRIRLIEEVVDNAEDKRS